MSGDPNARAGIGGNTIADEEIMRKYTDNPEAQTQAVQNLLDHIKLNQDEPELAEALKAALKRFVLSFPDFLTEKHTPTHHHLPDETLITQLRDVLEER